MHQLPDRLVEDWEPKVNKIARSYYVPTYDFEDVRQEVYIRLLHCNDRYDPEAGASFLTFFHGCAYNYLMNLKGKVTSRWPRPVDDYMEEYDPEVHKAQRCNPISFYLSQVDAEEDDTGYTKYLVDQNARTEFDDPYDEAETRLRELGFTDLEIQWVIYCKVYNRKPSKLAERYGLDADQLQRAGDSAKDKLRQLKESFTREDVLSGWI